MSCELGCPLSLGVFGVEDPSSPTSLDSLMREDKGFRYWIDGKARPVVVSTPVRHCGTFDELTDEELVEFWRGMGRTLTWLELPSFQRLVVNVGMYQTHAHIHLKAYIEQKAYVAAARGSEVWREEGLAGKYERIEGWVKRVAPRKGPRGQKRPAQ
jgi:diadenosine tetraphosphate (Ap4A) HIT family hydrolase